MAEKTVSEIAQEVFRNQLEAMQANLEGCILGQDPIHLHDLRVANRRTRSALTEFKKLIPGEVFNKYQEDFRWIQSVTGEVRDLDVNLQHYPNFKRQIRKEWRPHLAPLKELLESRREKAQKELIEVLDSDRLHEIFSSWSEVIKSDLLSSSAISLEPAREFGCLRIIKRYQGLRNKGMELSKKSPAETFHSYRILVKKLRYLMEFFRKVVETNDFTNLRTGLKAVQDAFGAFQDAEVQALQLRNFAGELHQAGIPADTLLALGQLVVFLEDKGKRSKKACLKGVRWIMEDATARSFQACFQYPIK
jgi:CHAD domain-containing protein